MTLEGNRNSSYFSPVDTIAAPITAPGQAAISVLRLSGPKTRAIIERVVPQAERVLGSPRELVLAEIRAGKETVDHCLAAFFPAPRSYTGEDCAEFSLHGSPFLLSRVLELLHQEGARAARPGEFTQRAFLNGRMDLSQAEAVADLVAAETELQARAARRQLAGELSTAVSRLGEPLRHLLAEIEACLDFPEEGIEPAAGAEWLSSIGAVESSLARYLATFSLGRLCREGADVVLLGAPNTGKSSLLNTLAGEERAIVTPIPGTTRDSIEGRLNLQGLFVRLWDTAGLNEGPAQQTAADEVERLGVERSWRKAQTADLSLFVFDGASLLRPQFELCRKVAALGRPMALVLNKTDLLRRPEDSLQELTSLNLGAVYAVSALSGRGVPQLAAAIRETLIGGGAGLMDAALLITNRRHFEALSAAKESLLRASSGLHQQQPLELITLELRAALGALSEIIGVTTSEDILGRIFSRFCIGK